MLYLRRFLIGFGFCLFGLIGLLGNLFFIPIVLFGLQKHKKFRYFSRDLVRWSWFVYLQLLRITGVISYSFEASIKPHQKQLIIANHPSLLDVVFLLAYIPRANCVVKASLRENIFLSFAIRASGYVANVSTELLLEESLTLLEEESLILFPEGTRTKDEINFHKAVSYLAIHGAETIEMLYIHAHQDALKKEQKWYNIPRRRLTYEIFSLGEKNLLEFETDKPNPLRVRALHNFLNHKYKTQQKEQRCKNKI